MVYPDYYKKEIFGKLFADYHKAVKNINDNHYLAKLPIIDFQQFEKDAFRRLGLDMRAHRKLNIETVPTQLLGEFLLENKAERRGDNARDFLIFYTLLSACQENPDETFVLISKDRIFQENDFFKRQLRLNSIENLIIYDHIAAFLSDVGPKVPWLTNEIIYAAIDPIVFERELMDDIGSLPSYISNYYYDNSENEMPSLEKLTINKYEILDFYVYPHPDTEVLMVNVDVRVSVDALYGISPDPISLRKYLDQRPVKTISKPEKFDSQGRLIYDEDILFLFEAELDQENESLNDFKFVDFFPSYFRYDNFQLGTGFDLLPLDPYRAGG